MEYVGDAPRRFFCVLIMRIRQVLIHNNLKSFVSRRNGRQLLFVFVEEHRIEYPVHTGSV